MDIQSDGSDEVRQLLHKQVPELASGVVQIKGIVRQGEHRTILAVHSIDSSIDPVGACVGERGNRIKSVSQQLSGEKIDIIRWSESTEEFIRNLLAPTRADRIVLDTTKQLATIHVSPDDRSRTLVDQGLRLQMMSLLVGWNLQVVDNHGPGPEARLDEFLARLRNTGGSFGHLGLGRQNHRNENTA